MEDFTAKAKLTLASGKTHEINKSAEGIYVHFVNGKIKAMSANLTELIALMHLGEKRK